MKNTLINKEGLYLFKSPATANVALNREIAVILTSPKNQTSGLVIIHPNNHLNILTQMLDTLLEKMIVGLGFSNQDIQAKVFGLQYFHPVIHRNIKAWMKKHQVEIVAEDTGKGFSRELKINFGTGKVGISYASPLIPIDVPFISTGTARLRNPKAQIYTEVLILTSNRVSRTLAKQAVEELPNWVGTSPKNAEEFLSKKIIDDFSYAVVILFSDLPEKDVEKWVVQVRLKMPSVQFRWSGISLPNFAKRLTYVKQLPPIDPIFIPEFKKKLNLSANDFHSLNTNDVIEFPKKKKKKIA